MSARRRTVAAAVALLLLAAGSLPLAAANARGGARAVIVQASSSGAAARLVERVGGRVGLPLDVIGAIAAHVDDESIGILRALGATVTPDVVLEAADMAFDADAVDSQVAALNPGLSGGPDAGAGVNVALIDTGVAESADFGDRVHHVANFSGDAGPGDGYGHGTFMAGLIAGSRTGAAPAADVLSVKAGGADGSTTMSRVIAGLGWVATHAADYQIRVLSLSFGIDVPMPYQANPLDAAIEAVWATGVTVVTAAGNGGGPVTSPGDDPYAITVGASDTKGTATTADDVRAEWSNEEHFGRYSKPELLAPGERVVSVAAVGSTVWNENPQARVEGGYLRGSGTSMATALAAGAAAVLAGHHPAATPDDIKGALVAAADPVAGSIGRAIDLAEADAAVASVGWWQRHPLAFGGADLRSIGATRNGMPWTAGRWVTDYWTAGRWVAGRWVDHEWQAGRWVDGSWTAGRWVAGRWVDGSWTAGRWVAGRWVDGSWTSGRWVAGRWVHAHWVDEQWA